MKRLLALFVILIPFSAQAGQIQDLIDEGVLGLYQDYRSGHLLDMSGNGNNGTATNITWQGRGVRFPAGNSLITVADSTTIRVGSQISIFCFGSFSEQTGLASGGRLVAKANGGANGYIFSSLDVAGTANLELDDGTNNAQLAQDIEQVQSLSLSAVSGSAPAFYVNGLFVGNGGVGNTFTAGNANLIIGNSWAANQNLVNSTLYAVLIVSRSLTATEQAALHSELAQHWPRKTIGHAKGTYGDIVYADWNFETAGVADWTAGSANLTKQTGNATDGTQVLRITKTGAATGYASQTVMTSGNTYRVVGWARGDGTSHPRIGGGSYHWIGTTSTLWQPIDTVIESWTGVNAYMYCYAGGAANWCEFDDMKIRPYSLDEIQFKTDWGVHASNVNIASGQISNSPIWVQNGTWKINTNTISGETVKTLECVTTGGAYIDFGSNIRENAEGTFTFSMYVPSTKTGTVCILDQATWGVAENGYCIQLYTSGPSAPFGEKNAGVWTSIGYITPIPSSDAWHEYKMTRDDFTFEFYVYVDGVQSLNLTDTTNQTARYLYFRLTDGVLISLGSRDGDNSILKGRGVQ